MRFPAGVFAWRSKRHTTHQFAELLRSHEFVEMRKLISAELRGQLVRNRWCIKHGERRAARTEIDRQL
jgi:hypothetical protein